MSPETPSLNPNIRVPKNVQAAPMVYKSDSAGPPGSETIGAPGSEETKPWTWPVGSGRKTPLSKTLYFSTQDKKFEHFWEFITNYIKFSFAIFLFFIFRQFSALF